MKGNEIGQNYEKRNEMKRKGSKEKTNWKRNEMGQEHIERNEMKGNRTGLVNMKWKWNEMRKLIVAYSGS